MSIRIVCFFQNYYGSCKFVPAVPSVPATAYLRTKVLDKHFWESDDIYVRNFVQKTGY